MIKYLNKLNDVKAPFLERLGSYNDERLKRLNKITQKTIITSEQDGIIRGKDAKKKRLYFKKTAEMAKDELQFAKNNLTKYKEVIKQDLIRKKYTKRELLINKLREAEYNWKKYKAYRFYNKNNPPVNCEFKQDLYES